MGIAQDLLRQADHLATYEGVKPSQASLRRAVSTAYYALFHLLVEEAGKRWQGSAEARTGFERGFQHGPMLNTSMQFRKPDWRDWHGQRQAVPQALQQVASAFVDLQEDRHAADYDNHEQWSAIEVQEILNAARSAFRNWESIRNHPMAGNYLLHDVAPQTTVLRFTSRLHSPRSTACAPSVSTRKSRQRPHRRAWHPDEYLYKAAAAFHHLSPGWRSPRDISHGESLSIRSIAIDSCAPCRAARRG